MDGIKNKQEFRKWCALCQDGRQSDYTVFYWSVFNGEEIIILKKIILGPANFIESEQVCKLWHKMALIKSK